MTRFRLAIWTMSLALMAGCGSDRVAGGGSSESGNAIVLGRVLDSSGLAVAGAWVRAVDQAQWLARTLQGRTPTLDSVRTDGQGRFRLRLPKASRYNLEVQGTGWGGFERDAHLSAAGTGTVVRVHPLGTAGGVLAARGGTVKALRLSGTTFLAALGSDGTYRFPGLPPGRYAPLALLATESDSAAATGASFRVKAGLETRHDLQLDRDAFLIEDFEGPWPRSRLSELTGGGNWHEVTDSGHAGQRSLLEHALREGSDSYDGTSLWMQVRLDSSYAGVGLHLGPAPGGYDLGGMRALRFQAKGRGRLRVSVESKLLDSLGEDQFEALVDLPSDWAPVVIPVDSLRLPAGSAASGMTWSVASRRIIRIEFLFLRPSTAPGDTSRLSMDDISLLGVHPTDWVP